MNAIATSKAGMMMAKYESGEPALGIVGKTDGLSKDEGVPDVLSTTMISVGVGVWLRLGVGVAVIKTTTLDLVGDTIPPKGELIEDEGEATACLNMAVGVGVIPHQPPFGTAGSHVPKVTHGGI